MRISHFVSVILVMAACVRADGAQQRSSESAASAREQPFSRMYVFGDSYSDTGAGYVDGNGRTAMGYLAQDLGLKLAVPNDPDANAESINFAVSGAQTGHGPG